MKLRKGQRVLTYDEVREKFTFYEDSGQFIWNSRNRESFNTKAGFSIFNARFAGRPFGGLHEATGYIYGNVGGRVFAAHRLIWLWMTGEWPDQVDHINGMRNDNRWCNLRNVDRSANMKNASMRTDNTSGFVGVYYVKRSGKWIAKLVANGVAIHIGTFDSPEKAAEARAEKQLSFGFTERHGEKL
jgi:hypothetical protein